MNRERTERVRQQGKDGESQVRMKWELQGYEVERTGRGHDFYARKRDPFTGKVIDSKYIEAKNGENARLSPLQKKMKRKYGSRYVEDRINPSPFSVYGFNAGSSSSGSKRKQQKRDRVSESYPWNLSGFSSSNRKKNLSYDDLFGLGSSSTRKKNRSTPNDMFGFGSSSRAKKGGKSDPYGFGSIGF